VSAVVVFLELLLDVVATLAELQNLVSKLCLKSSVFTVEVPFLVTKMFHLKLDVVVSCAKKLKEPTEDTSKLQDLSKPPRHDVYEMHSTPYTRANK